MEPVWVFGWRWERAGISLSAGIRVANITPSGDVYPCQFGQIPEFRIGSIRERKFSELWNDPDNPILNQFRNKFRQLTGKCGRCSILIYVEEDARDFSAEDPFCFIRT